MTQEHGVYVPPGPKWYCRVASLVNFICFMCSTLLILNMTFEGFYSIIRPHKAASFNTVKRAKITVGIIVIISFLYNIPQFYLSSNENWECAPYGKAKGNSIAELYYWLSFVVQFALPFVLLLVMNSVIIHKIRTRFKNQSHDRSIIDSNQSDNCQNKNSELQVFVTLLLVTFAFLILTTPAYLFFLFVIIIDFFKSPRLFALYYLFYNVSHKMYISNYGINFLLYVISGNKFRTDLTKIFPDFKKPKSPKWILHLNVHDTSTVQIRLVN